MKNLKYLVSCMLLLLALMTISSCSDFSEVNSISLEEQEVELAIPLVNTRFGVSDFTGDGGGENVSLVVDGQDRVTVVYKGDVVRQDVTAVFPTVEQFLFPLLDTVYEVPVPFAADQKVDRAIFGATKMQFAYVSSLAEDIEVTVTIPQLTLNGQQFEETFIIDHQGTTPVEYLSDSISIEGWTLVDDNKKILVNYDARTADGTRIKLATAIVIFHNITFDYVEGYFGSEIFDINGDFVAIGVLDTWRSGGLAFEDPKVNVFVENTFGFPVRSIFNTMQVVTTTGEMLNMESEIIDNNVDFAYPTLDEIGVVKITEFSFTKDNSNIVDLFQNKVRRVTYDIDAGANPDMDETVIGFVNEDSYFLVSVDVELPLNGTVNQLVLQDTIDLDLTDLTDGESAEFKNVIANDFPADITLQGYMYTKDGILVDSLFSERLFLPAAMVNGSGVASKGEEVTTFEDFDSARLDRVRQTEKLLVNVKINTNQASDGALWIYNSYGIDFRMGAKIKAKL